MNRTRDAAPSATRIVRPRFPESPRDGMAAQRALRHLRAILPTGTAVGPRGCHRPRAARRSSGSRRPIATGTSCAGLLG